MDPTPITRSLTALEYGIGGVFLACTIAAVIALWKRNNALADSVTAALINNTAALTALREGIRHD